MSSRLLILNVVLLVGSLNCGGGDGPGDGDVDADSVVHQDADTDGDADTDNDANTDDDADSDSDADGVDPGVPGPSCEGLGDICGPTETEGCCASGLVPGGSFLMGRGESGADAFDDPYLAENEVPEHEVAVASFRLDLYEVNVGRFRRFVEAYPDFVPADGAGANPSIPESGWQGSWNTERPADRDGLISRLKCNESYATWTDAAGPHESLPINCVDWYMAFAFCAWDGGWLPTEAEWEYAAAGGGENRLYPWGSEEPHLGLASHSCGADGVGGTCSFEDMLPVGSLPLGAGRWGHKNLASNMTEWVLDWYDRLWYAGGGADCAESCANLEVGSERSRRAGAWGNGAWNHRAVVRYGSSPTDRNAEIGFRCARVP